MLTVAFPCLIISSPHGNFADNNGCVCDDDDKDFTIQQALYCIFF